MEHVEITLNHYNDLRRNAERESNELNKVIDNLKDQIKKLEDSKCIIQFNSFNPRTGKIKFSNKEFINTEPELYAYIEKYMQSNESLRNDLKIEEERSRLDYNRIVIFKNSWWIRFFSLFGIHRY